MHTFDLENEYQIQQVHGSLQSSSSDDSTWNTWACRAGEAVDKARKVPGASHLASTLL